MALWLRPFVAIQRGVRARRSTASAKVTAGGLGAVLHHRLRVCLRSSSAFCAGHRGVLIPQLGQDFFPAVDAGQFRLHLRARSGTRIEETVKLDGAGRGGDSPRKSRPAKSRACSTTSGFRSGGIPPHLHRQRPDRHRRRGHPGLLAARTPAHRRATCGACALRLQPRVPRRDVLLPACRHRQPDDQFRTARPLRHPDHGPRSGCATASWPASLAEKLRRVPGVVDVRVQQPADLPRTASRRGPHQSLGTGLDRAERGQLDAAWASAAAARSSRCIGSIRAAASSTW